MKPWEMGLVEEAPQDKMPWEMGLEEDGSAQTNAAIQQNLAGMDAPSEEAMALANSMQAQEEKKKLGLFKEHPDFPAKARVAFKNFGDPNSPVSFNELQRRAPDFELKKEGRDVLVRKRGEQDWFNLDAPKLSIEDATDVLWDVPAAGVETIASGLGGIGGFFSGLPGGTLAGAAGAGGLASSGLETARQGIGKKLGMYDEFDTQSIKDAGMWGAVAPLVMGTGVGAKQIAKYAGKGLTPEVMEQAVRAQRGLPSQTFDSTKGWLGTKLGSLVSGESEDVLRNASKKLDWVDSAIDNKEDVKMIQGVFEDITSRQNDVANQVRNNYVEKLKGLDIKVNAREAEKPIVDLKNTLTKKHQDNIKNFYTEKIKSEGKKLAASGMNDKQVRKKVLMDATKQAEKKLDYDNLQYITQTYEKYSAPQKILKGEDIVKHQKNLNELTKIAQDPEIGKKSPIAGDLIVASRKAASNLDKKVTSSGASGKDFKEAKTKYGSLIEQEDEVEKYFGTPQKTEQTINQLYSGSTNRSLRNSKIEELSKRLGLDLKQTLLDIATIRKFSKPSMDMLSLGGTTSTSRTVPLAAMGGVGGYALGQASGGAVSPYLMSMIGAGAASKIASPAAMKQYMKANRKLGKLAGKVQNFGPGALPQIPQLSTNIWQQVGSKKQNYVMPEEE